ncbi:KpsF/GutQ family sugar-phosphate isomerase [Metabacillus litoralis]|uniref:KpsF/GutQ family sugar-phosphate isomerase n=1 Tax=Metabacillus litoralis TaxID=152268 RepID=UPI0020408D12|nr:KpsF/GutQ family sugar-phosphate isomerase [Metabacillus litoralis]MCM3412433.1 KpsF/GutQ family sugar-phosphate isomerase [Metabacillus litoralis]
MLNNIATLSEVKIGNEIDILSEARYVFDTEVNAINLVKDALDERFVQIVELISNCKGKVVVTGMGKPGHVSRKIAATLSSLGTSSFFLHPAEAQHGDLGMISSNDIVIAISYSGESEEITRILPNINLIGATIIGIAGNQNSTLVRYCDYSFVFPRFMEACSMNLAPTSSTTVEMVLGDALAICLAKIYGFQENNYALYHPAGSLGKKLLIKVSDIAHTGERNAVAMVGTKLKDAIIEMSTKAIGILNVVNEENELIGVFTDGDLRRTLTREVNVYELSVDDVLVKTPISINSDMLAVDALKLMKDKNISALPIIQNGKLIGTVRVNDILGVGIFV